MLAAPILQDARRARWTIAGEPAQCGIFGISAIALARFGAGQTQGSALTASAADIDVPYHCVPHGPHNRSVQREWY